MSRNHSAAYRRRNQLAQQRGFTSYAQQRRATRNPSSEAQLKALPEEARARRAEALDVISKARRLGITAAEAAVRDHVPLSAVVWWGEGALDKPRSRSPRVRKADRLLRAHPLAVDGEVQWITTRGSRAARTAIEARKAQQAYLDGERGAERALARFRGRRVGGHVIETDPAVLDEIGRRGDFGDIAEMYRAWLS
jgi:hypothetical protein